MTMDEAVRHAALAQAVIDAREWRETFDDHKNHEGKLNVVRFEQGYLSDRVKNSDTSQGFEGGLHMPRDIAIEMMRWLEDHTTKELEKHHHVQTNPLPRF